MRTRFVSDSCARSRSWLRTGRSGAGRPFRAAPVRKRPLLVEGSVDQEQEQEQEHDWPRPRRDFSGDFWPGAPGDERAFVFHSPKVAAGYVGPMPSSAKRPADEGVGSTGDPGPVAYTPGYERQRDGDFQDRNCHRTRVHPRRSAPGWWGRAKI